MKQFLVCFLGTAFNKKLLMTQGSRVYMHAVRLARWNSIKTHNLKLRNLEKSMCIV